MDFKDHSGKVKIVFLLLFIPIYVLFSGFFSLYQTGNLKNDGSGTLNIVYSGTIQQVVDNKYSLGNFPFGEKNIRDCFSSEYVNIKKLQIAKPGDTAYMVILDLEFSNINDLTKLKGFSDFNVALSKIDNGTEFKWTVNSNDRVKLLNVLNFTMQFESVVVSTNGALKDGAVKWFKTDFSKTNELTAVLKSEINISDKRESIIKETEKNSPENKAGSNNNKKEKICGMFGLELPLIIITGLVFSYQRRMKLRKK